MYIKSTWLKNNVKTANILSKPALVLGVGDGSSSPTVLPPGLELVESFGLESCRCNCSAALTWAPIKVQGAPSRPMAIIFFSAFGYFETSR